MTESTVLNSGIQPLASARASGRSGNCKKLERSEEWDPKTSDAHYTDVLALSLNWDMEPEGRVLAPHPIRGNDGLWNREQKSSEEQKIGETKSEDRRKYLRIKDSGLDPGVIMAED